MLLMGACEVLGGVSIVNNVVKAVTFMPLQWAGVLEKF